MMNDLELQLELAAKCNIKLYRNFFDFKGNLLGQVYKTNRVLPWTDEELESIKNWIVTLGETLTEKRPVSFRIIQAPEKQLESILQYGYIGWRVEK